jgi:single-strand DNA-binding protein
MSFNATFKARLGADPEFSTSSNGTPMTKLRVVTNRRRLVNNTWEDTDTSWWSVTAFGKQAEAAAATLHKGDLVIIEGRIKQREWEKDGIKRTSAEITAEEIAYVLKATSTPALHPSDPGNPWTNETAPF